jgi:signal peptidase II
MQKDPYTRSVKTSASQAWVFVLLVALLVAVDEWLKYLGLQRLPDEGSLVDPGLVSFAIHKNWGVAFDIPFRLEFVIFISLLIGLGLLHIAVKNRSSHPNIAFASVVIMLGALGNLYDRIVYGFTVDYIIILGRSAINISDIVIVSGVVLLLLHSRKSKRRLTHAKK